MNQLFLIAATSIGSLLIGLTIKGQSPEVLKSLENMSTSLKTQNDSIKTQTQYQTEIIQDLLTRVTEQDLVIQQLLSFKAQASGVFQQLPSSWVLGGCVVYLATVFTTFGAILGLEQLQKMGQLWADLTTGKTIIGATCGQVSGFFAWCSNKIFGTWSDFLNINPVVHFLKQFLSTITLGVYSGIGTFEDPAFLQVTNELKKCIEDGTQKISDSVQNETQKISDSVSSGVQSIKSENVSVLSQLSIDDLVASIHQLKSLHFNFTEMHLHLAELSTNVCQLLVNSKVAEVFSQTTQIEVHHVLAMVLILGKCLLPNKEPEQLERAYSTESHQSVDDLIENTQITSPETFREVASSSLDIMSNGNPIVIKAVVDQIKENGKALKEQQNQQTEIVIAQLNQRNEQDCAELAAGGLSAIIETCTTAQRGQIVAEGAISLAQANQRRTLSLLPEVVRTLIDDLKTEKQSDFSLTPHELFGKARVEQQAEQIESLYTMAGAIEEFSLLMG